MRAAPHLLGTMLWYIDAWPTALRELPLPLYHSKTLSFSVICNLCTYDSPRLVRAQTPRSWSSAAARIREQAVVCNTLPLTKRNDGIVFR